MQARAMVDKEIHVCVATTNICLYVHYQVLLTRYLSHYVITI